MGTARRGSKDHQEQAAAQGCGVRLPDSKDEAERSGQLRYGRRRSWYLIHPTSPPVARDAEHMHCATVHRAYTDAGSLPPEHPAPNRN